MTPGILVVEDEAIAALAIRLMLENSGFVVLGVAASGEEGIALAQELLPDLVIMDVRLKGKMSGIESAKIIQSHREVPVIFTTAYSSAELDDSVKNVQFLAKPINANELALAVRSALETTVP